MSNIAELVFQEELTEAGLQELRSKYPASLVVDMSDDEQFKAARKTRTEMNKLTEAINRRRIDVCNEIKSRGDNLVKQVEEIYSVIVQPFEVEDQRRKEIAAEEKRKRDALLAQERAQINSIAGAVADCLGKSSQYIQDTIEAIDLIETAGFDKELIHEAIEAKQKTLSALGAALSQAMVNEAAAEATRKAEQQMAEMRAQMEAMQKQLREQEELKRQQEAAEQAKIEREAMYAQAAERANQQQAETVAAIQPMQKPESFTRAGEALKNAPESLTVTVILPADKLSELSAFAITIGAIIK